MAPDNFLGLPISDTYISVEDFGATFRELFAETKQEFFKVERLQEYQEPENPSFVAYMMGNIEEATALLVEGLSSSADFFRQTAERNLLYTRVRLAELPLSQYLKWEFMSYQVSARYGERILVNDISNLPEQSSLKSGGDYVMFDNRIVLRHNYNSSGLLEGAWLIERKEDVEKYKAFGQLARYDAVPLAQFEHQHGL